YVRAIANLSDNLQAVFVTYFIEQFQAVHAQSLERIRRSARLESTGAQYLNTQLHTKLCNLFDLLLRLYTAWTGDDQRVIRTSSYDYIADTDFPFCRNILLTRQLNIAVGHKDFIRRLLQFFIRYLQL